jgi:site-specific recombinase XerD
VLGFDPATYNASLIRRFIIEEAERCSPSVINETIKALRGYLKFLVAHGVCQPGIEGAVPAVAQWRLSSLPLYLLPTDVEKLIMTCDLTTPVGIRDHAILLLLARLGLRNGDILTMCLSDIDWDGGTLMVCGKGRREVRLPLPQDAGDALLSYLTEARPHTGNTRVFLTSCAPFRPFKYTSNVSSVVNRGLKRAGITNAPSRGATLLRHSAATAMLRSGATLDAIGVVLRHRSVNTTAHYAKVDFPTLKKVVQPWPGDESC